MKSSEEMVNSLLERRDRYEEEKKRKRAVVLRAAASVCCVCLIALLGVGLWAGGAFSKAEPKQTPGLTEQTTDAESVEVIPVTEQKVQTEQSVRETDTAEEVKYITMGTTGDWPVYESVRELSDAGNVIVSGKITGISFDFVDPCLYTEYKIEVITSYKGDASDTLDLRLMGGMEGVYIDDQKAALGDKAGEGIPLTENRPDLEIGQTYLFVLHEYEKGKATLVNIDQGAYDLSEPLVKDVFGFVSANDIVSFFGDDITTTAATT